MKYTSKIIDLPRNKETVIELPFKANYLYVKIVKDFASNISLTLDDGEDIVMIGEEFALDFEFKKIVFKVGEMQHDVTKIFYFFSGKGDGETQPDVTVENPLKDNVMEGTKQEVLSELKNALISLSKALEK